MTGRFDGGASAVLDQATFYADQNALKQLTRNTDQSQGIEQAAREFEGLFINMMFKGMREANAAFESDGLFNSREATFYREMLDSQLSAELARGGGIGLAQIMMRQMMPPDAQTLPPDLTDFKNEKPDAPERLARPAEKPVSVERARTLFCTDKTPENHSEENKALNHSVKNNAFPNEITHDLYGDSESVSMWRESSEADDVESPRLAATMPDHQNDGPVFEPVSELAPAVVPAFNSPESFVAEMWSHAETAARQLGVDPGILVAQAALETGWGKHIMSDGAGGTSHNLFGVKSGSSPMPQAVHETTEFENDRPYIERASFRVYDSFASSFDDYVRLLKRSRRYSDAMRVSTDGEAFMQALQNAGYATDPQYADKVMRIYRGLPAKLARIVQPDSEGHSESIMAVAQRDSVNAHRMR